MLCHHSMCDGSAFFFKPSDGIAEEFIHKRGAVHKRQQPCAVVYYVFFILLTDVVGEVSAGREDKCLSELCMQGLPASQNSQTCTEVLQNYSVHAQ